LVLDLTCTSFAAATALSWLVPFRQTSGTERHCERSKAIQTVSTEPIWIASALEAGWAEDNHVFLKNGREIFLQTKFDMISD
jgi:hypothetical protein